MSGFAEADRINNRVNLIRERFQRGQEQVLNELLNMNSVDGCNFNLPTANIPSECLQTITDLYMQRENHGGDLNKKIDANRLIAAFQRILQNFRTDNQQQQRDEVIQPLIFLPILLLIFFILFYIIYYNKIQAEAQRQAEAEAQRRAFQEIMQFVPREIQMNLDRRSSCRGDDCNRVGGGNDDKLLINNLIDAFIKRYNEVKKLDKDDNKVIQILNKFKDIISKGETVKQLETELTELTKLKISDGGGKRRKSKRRKTRKRKSKKRRKRRRRGKSLKKRTSSRKR